MKLTWLGHAGWRIEAAGETLLVDPWLTGNPMFPADRRAEAIAGATAILVTHGHADHSADVPAIARETGAKIVCIAELGDHWGAAGLTTVGMNKGGTVRLGEVAVSMVNACHSTLLDAGPARVPTGSEAGFMIAAEGRMIYVSGDTDLMADMGWFGEYYRPDIGILNCGGHYTMDMKAAAWGARKWFNFKVLFPSHYRTFGLLAQSAEELVTLMPPNVRVVTPEPMEAVTL